MSIYVIDEIMGRGKTTAMINHINASPIEQRFLFVTPFLSEVARVREACCSRGFLEPLESGGKLQNLKKLLAEKCNVVTTHALFSRFDSEVLALVREGGYVLVMDEVASVVSAFDASEYDCKLMSDRFVSADDGFLLSWNEDEYSGKLNGFKEVVDRGCTYLYNDTHWVTLTPPAIFYAFKDIYIMTYMFQHQIQRCYFDLKGMHYTRLYVAGDSPETYRLTDTHEPGRPMDFTQLIHIEQNAKLNSIGEKTHALSKNWYKKHYYEAEMKQLQKNIYNFFRNYAKTPSSQNLWTTYAADTELRMDWPKVLSGGGYAKSFLSCNAKGTNEYRDRTAAAYTINLFPNTAVRNFLKKNGIFFNQDMYALSEMIQWIWRTAIRDGKEIYIYIPSKRMRTLLTKWMDDVKSGKV